MLFEEILFPRLITAYQSPLSTLEMAILNESSRIESWFSERWQKTPALITTSVDLRYAGFKIAPVDTNVFPAGFNNLNENMISLCVKALKKAILARKPTCSRILILPENHTRNLFYMKSLIVLRDCLLQAGFKVHIGSLDSTLTQPKWIDLGDTQRILIEPLKRLDNQLYVGDFKPCFVLLNHDLSSGIPDILKDISQSIYPAFELGWGSRLKSSHFLFFEHIADEFSELIQLDSWFINPIHRAVDGVDFMEQVGLDHLAVVVDEVLTQVSRQYQKYDIRERPFVVVKADNGTYGMGVMMVHSGQEVLQLNRRQRTRMASRKGGQKVTQILVQEGIYSIETMPNQAVAEPVIYLIGQSVVGGFYRIHQEKSVNENLNTPGMYFEPMPFASHALEAYSKTRDTDVTNRFYVYGVIARLAALAAAHESAALV